MHRMRRVNDAVHRFMGELTSRVVAESGIPSDRFHIGKIILQSLKDAPDFLSQIDGATDETETNQSVLERSVRCAIALKKIGLKSGDVMVLMAPNHIHTSIPFYAALYLGVTIAATDRFLTANELLTAFEQNKPKVVFCQSEKLSDVNKALDTLGLKADVITFDGEDTKNFDSFLKSCNEPVEKFIATDYDPDETNAFLISTSGTTGTRIPKAAAYTHTKVAISFPYTWVTYFEFPTPTRMAFVTSHLEWLTALIHFILSPILRYTRLQSSHHLSPEHIWHLINTYKPTYMFVSPILMTNLITNPEKCDFSCFELIQLGGSAVFDDLMDKLKEIMPNTEVVNIYGMSEVGYAFNADNPPKGSSGKPIGYLRYRLVDVDTQEDITEPNVPGELWLQGPTVFKGYYNNPEETEKVFAEDGWFKSGDIFYRDENWNFFFVDRIKLLLMYMNYNISPVEVEGVIRQHPGVMEVVVTGIPDPECGDWLVACVVRRSGHNVTAQEIKDLVKDQLTDSKQLRGGVIFLKELPTTSTGKLHRRKIKELAQKLEKE